MMISTKKVFFGLKGKGNNSKWDRKQTRYFWCTWININKSTKSSNGVLTKKSDSPCVSTDEGVVGRSEPSREPNRRLSLLTDWTETDAAGCHFG